MGHSGSWHHFIVRVVHRLPLVTDDSKTDRLRAPRSATQVWPGAIKSAGLCTRNDSEVILGVIGRPGRRMSRVLSRSSRTLPRAAVLIASLVGVSAFEPAYSSDTESMVTATAADTAAPVYVSRTLSSSSVDVSNGPSTIKLRVRFTDDTGAAQAYVKITHPGTGQSYYFSGLALESGTVQNGVWSGTVTLPQGAAPGTWDVSAFAVQDTLGNTTGQFLPLASVNRLSQRHLLLRPGDWASDP